MTAAAQPERNTAEAWWEQGKDDVNEYLERGRENARLTIPKMLPPDGHTSGSRLYVPWRNIGARGLNSLTSRFVQTVVPSGSSFFRYDLSAATLEQLAGETEGEDIKTESAEALRSMEKEVHTFIDANGIREPAYRGVRQSLGVGNVLLHLDENDKLRAFPLTHYRVWRDGNDVAYRILLRQEMQMADMPDAVRGAMAAGQMKGAKLPEHGKPLPIFTRIERIPGSKRYRQVQEVCGEEVDGTEAFFTEDNLPWLAHRWENVEGENYGRAYLDDVIGDLATVDSLARSLTEITSDNARRVYLRRPGAMFSRAQFAKARSGAVLDGGPEDISTVKRDGDATGVQQAFQFLESTMADLRFAFFMLSAVQRQAERVTAEEIRTMAADLDLGLGPSYASAGMSLQRWLEQTVRARLTAKGKIPKLPAGVEVHVVTGLEALGRTADFQRLRELLDTANATMGPEVIGQYLKPNIVLKQLGTALSVDTKELVRSEQEVQQQQMDASRLKIAENMAPGMATDPGASGAAPQ